MRVFLNLCAGLDQLGIKYRVNQYRYAQRHPDELVCILGKPHVLEMTSWKNPILYGPAIQSHPLDAPDILERFDIRKVLVPGEWMRLMCEPYYGSAVRAWPVGIDTDAWSPVSGIEGKDAITNSGSDGKTVDFLLYDKVRWQHEHFQATLIRPIQDALTSRGLSFEQLRYGFYREEDYNRLLGRSRAMIFLCEHETQGIAYQQALSAGVPIFAWDRGGHWKDPAFYPHLVQYSPVSSVPYWDERCGLKFANIQQFHEIFDKFHALCKSDVFQPRAYITENLSLSKCAAEYVAIANGLTVA